MSAAGHDPLSPELREEMRRAIFAMLQGDLDAFLDGKTYRRGPRNPVVGYERLHLWYGKDRGKVLDAEFCALLRRRIGGA